VKKLLFAIFAGFIGLSAVATDTVSDGKVATTVGFVTEQMAPLQDNFSGQSGTKAVTFGTESGQNIPRTVTDSMGTSTSDNSLPTAGAAKTALDAKQDTIPANDSNSVLTYTGVAGSIGSKGIYQDTGTYAEQMDDLVTAETFNSALANGLNNEFICAEYDPAEPDKCWLWEIRALNPNAKTNYFIMDRIPEWSQITRNADGSITVRATTSYTVLAGQRTLAQLAPGLEAGKQYKFTINTTGAPSIVLYKPSNDRIVWQNSTTKTMTADLLDHFVLLQSNGQGTTVTISSIRIEEADDDTTILPNGYTPVEYVQNAASTYVNTGITPDQDDVEMEIRYYCGASGYANYIFQSRPTSGSDDIWGIAGSKTGNTINASWMAVGSGIQSDITRTVGHVYKMNMKYKDGVLTFSVFDETSGQSDVKSKSLSFIAPSVPLGIFGNTGGNRIAAGHRVYYAWIKVNGEYVMNYIPAIYNNTAGFYDTVSKTFKGKTSGSLTAGPATNNNLYLPQGQ